MAPTKRPYTFTAEQRVLLQELAERKHVKVKRKNKEQIEEPEPVPDPEPEPEPVPEPDQECKRIKHKYVQKELNVYPYLGDRDALKDVGLYGTVKAVQKTVRKVLAETGIRTTVPLAQMAAAAKNVRKTLANRRVERYGSSIPALDATADEAFSEFTETTCGMDKSIFRVELLKYQAIAATQLDKLSTLTLLSMATDLMKGRSNMVEYEPGGPQKPSAGVDKFFGLTKLQYNCLTDHQQLTLLKEHTKHRYKYYKEYEVHLNLKYQALMDEALARTRGKKKSKISKSDPFKHWPEGRTREEDLSFAFDKCRDMQRFIHMEFERLLRQEEDCVLLYSDVWRHMYLKEKLQGKKGPLTEEDEFEADREFAKTPLDVLKEIEQRYMDECEEVESDEEEKEEKDTVSGEKEDTVDGMEVEENGNEKDVEPMEEENRMEVQIIEKENDENEMDWNRLEGEIMGMGLEEKKEEEGDKEGKKKKKTKKRKDKLLVSQENEMEKENEGEKEEEKEGKNKKKKKKKKDKLRLLREEKERSPPTYVAPTPAYHSRHEPL